MKAEKLSDASVKISRLEEKVADAELRDCLQGGTEGGGDHTPVPGPDESTDTAHVHCHETYLEDTSV